jgi:hypothetical protein
MIREQRLKFVSKCPSETLGSLALFRPENMTRFEFIPDLFVELSICAEILMNRVY